MSPRIWFLALAVPLACLLALTGTAEAATDPVLVRTCYFIAPEDSTEFRRAYHREVAPLLGDFGLAPSTHAQRATVDSACCFLYEAPDVASLQQAAQELLAHRAASAANERLRRRFRPDRDPSEWKDWLDFRLYRVPSVHADTVALGPGTGRWRSFYMGDGLPNTEVYSILHASDGTLWLASGGGVCRYDGRRFETVEAGPGAVGQAFGALAETPDGSIWFARSPNWAGSAHGTPQPPADRECGGLFRPPAKRVAQRVAGGAAARTPP